MELPQYLSDNVKRVFSVTSQFNQGTEAFSRTIIDQILISAIYEENAQSRPSDSISSTPEDPASLSLQYETTLERQVIYDGEERLLSGSADYTVWYEPKTPKNLSANLIIVEAKKMNGTDTCLGQLAAYMGIVHNFRKEEGKTNSVVYGIASDGLSFRFCRIDNEDCWSSSKLLEWKRNDKTAIYSIFRILIRIAALSSPSTSPLKNPKQRERIITSFESPERVRKFDYALSALEIIEVDEDEVEIVSLQSPEQL